MAHSTVSARDSATEGGAVGASVVAPVNLVKEVIT
jgi:hypothetical protein